VVKIMAGLYKQRARKEYKCGKCGRVIRAGEEYYRISKRYWKSVRCIDCKPRPSELHTGYVADLMAVAEELDDWLVDGTKEELESLLTEQVSILENIRDEMEEKANNIEEYFYGSELAENLYERAESTAEAIELMNDLQDNLEQLSKEEIEEKIEEIKDALEEAQVTF